MTDDGATMNRPTPCSPLSAPRPSMSLRADRIGGKALAVRHGRDEAGRRQNLEALIDAGQEFGRDNLALDGAELHAFGLLLDRSEPAGGIDFGLDAAAGILLDGRGIILGILMQHIVQPSPA